MRKLFDFDGNILYTCGLDVLCVVKWTLSNKRILFQQKYDTPRLELHIVYLKNCNNLSLREDRTQGI